MDGEGNIDLRKGKKHTGTKGGGEFNYNIHITIGNTYKPVLDYIKKKFGGNICLIKAHKGNKPLYCWHLYCKNAAIFLTKILPYLKEKKKKAKIAIKFQETVQQRVSYLPISVKKQRVKILKQWANLKKEKINYSI